MSNRPFVFGNKATKVVHDGRANNDQCRESEIKASNRVEFKSLAEAVEAGYRLCKSCYPEDADTEEVT